MKNSHYYPAIILILFFLISANGNKLNAGPEQRPYILQKNAFKKHKYYYYPRQNVYYDPSEKVYFIWERTYWKPVAHLPNKYVSVTYSSTPKFALWMTSTHPYYYNPQHRKTYYKYRVVKPAPVPKARVSGSPKSTVSFHLEFSPVVVQPEPVYVERHVVVVKEKHPKHHHHPGRGHGKGKRHKH